MCNVNHVALAISWQSLLLEVHTLLWGAAGCASCQQVVHMLGDSTINNQIVLSSHFMTTAPFPLPFPHPKIFHPKAVILSYLFLSPCKGTSKKKSSKDFLIHKISKVPILLCNSNFS